MQKYSDRIIKFANGGDRNSNTTPEKEFCDQNQIETLWGLFQSAKIISNFDCFNNYEDILKPGTCKFKQKTSAISYFIIKTYMKYRVQLKKS